jgi:glycine/D-amino acid oxidase-like deaminating enzyme
MPRTGTVVIGAGVIGASIATELHRNGAEVFLIDAGIPGEGVSGASWAWVNSSPSKSPKSYWMLNLFGLEMHHRLHNEGEAPWFHPTGSLEIGIAERSHPRTSSTTFDTEFGQSGYSDLEDRSPTIKLRSDQIKTMYPYLADYIADGICYPRDGWIDIQQMLFEMVTSLPGDRVLTAARVDRVISSEKDIGSTVKLSDGRSLQAEHVVIANGNGATPLIEQLSPGLKLIDPNSENTHTGLIVETYPADQPLTKVIRTEEVWMRPTRDGGAVIIDPAISASYGDFDPALWDAPRVLVERAEKLAPGLGKLRIRSVRIGARVWPQDGRTVCGWVADGVYTVLTHSGVTLAPYLAECVRNELDGGTVADLANYRPERFLESC